MLDLLLITAVPEALETALKRHFRLHHTPVATRRAIVGGGQAQVGAALIESLPKLEIIAIHGVGHGGIDLEAARRAGVRVTITPAVLTEDVADLALGLMLSVERRIAANDRAVRAGKWRVPLGRRASNRGIGVFGMSAIGGRSPAERSRSDGSSSTRAVRRSQTWPTGSSRN